MAEEAPTQEQDQQQEQTPSTPTYKVARLSSDAAGVVTTAAPSPLVLGLGLGAGDGKPAITFMQVQELQHQALIYKYMAAGVPVPLHLVLPIWKSVAAAAGGPHRYPTLMGWGSLCLDYRNNIEPEPGRCRRTDGKKWRCSRDVVPGQKYCERHMHRGRNRSRKPVEAGGGAGSVGCRGIPTAVAITTSTAGSSRSMSVPTGAGLQLMPAATNCKPNSSSSSNSNSNNASPTRLGFSPSSVLQSGDPSKNGPS